MCSYKCKFGACAFTQKAFLGKAVSLKLNKHRFKQARKPRSYASPKLCPLTHSLTDRGKV